MGLGLDAGSRGRKVRHFDAMRPMLPSTALGSFAAFAAREGGIQTVLCLGWRRPFGTSAGHLCLSAALCLSWVLSTPRGLATDSEVLVPVLRGRGEVPPGSADRIVHSSYCGLGCLSS